MRSRQAGGPPSLGVRRRRGPRRLVRVSLLLLLVVLLAGGVTWLVGWSPVLAVQRVQVEGTSMLTADEVTETARVPVGRPLARVDLTAIEDRVTTLGPVQQVRVERGWPVTVRIELTERTPVLAVQTDEGLQLVDGSGVAFAEVAEPPDGVVPAEVAGGVGLSPADRAELLGDLATAVQAMPPELVAEVSSVETDSADTIEIALSEDRRVEWGSADDSALKAEVLLVLLEQEGEVYNVTVPSHPTVR